MANSYFQFKQFTIHQDKCAMKVTTDACLFGAWAAERGRRHDAIVENILDIGAGTGLLSLIVAQKINTDIDAIEIDNDAAEQAKENITTSSFKNNISIINTDINEYISYKKYNIIISNPPFYENELNSLSDKKNTAHHSSQLSLEELLKSISQLLNPGGQFFLLLPYKRLSKITLLIKQYKLSITGLVLIKQSTKHDYFRIFITGKHAENSEENYTKTELAIKNEKNEYTSEFIGLLKDYYLYL